MLKFRDRHWRCETIGVEGQRCLNYRPGHSKGHQFLLMSKSGENCGVVLGEYSSSYDEIEIMNDLEKAIFQLNSPKNAWLLFPNYARASGINKILSNRTCLLCLSNCPTNILPCRPIQHGICEDCLYRSRKITNRSTIITLDLCSLGCAFDSPWVINLKPESVGARILSLDG